MSQRISRSTGPPAARVEGVEQRVVLRRVAAPGAAGPACARWRPSRGTRRPPGAEAHRARQHVEARPHARQVPAEGEDGRGGARHPLDLLGPRPHPLVARVAAEELVAAVAGQGDRDVLAGQPRDRVGGDRRRVGERLVEGLDEGRQRLQRLVARRAEGRVPRCRGAAPPRRRSATRRAASREADREGPHVGSHAARMQATTRLESVPPDRNAPTGTSATMRRARRLAHDVEHLAGRRRGSDAVGRRRPPVGLRPPGLAPAVRSTSSQDAGGSFVHLAQDRAGRARTGSAGSRRAPRGRG